MNVYISMYRVQRFGLWFPQVGSLSVWGMRDWVVSVWLNQVVLDMSG